MATGKTKEPETGTLGRFSKRGEEALNRLVDELGKNDRVSDALERAASAKGKVDDASRRALGQAGLAAADEVKELRRHVERLEKRLAKLEGSTKAKPGTKTSASKATTRAKTKKKADAPPSPAQGRAVGGGTGRGSG